MKFALIGYGKMGKLVEEIALQNEHQIVAKISSKEQFGKMSKKDLNGADVCIDFSTPHDFIQNLKILASLGATVVVGTTGWYGQMDLVKEVVERYKIGFLYAPNFSIGVNIFYKIVEHAAKLINSFDEYDAACLEVHHSQKKDSPSGTAKAIGSLLLNHLNKKTEVIYDKIDRPLEKNELHIASVRGGSNPGEHTVIFDSSADTITLQHQARNRTGFARGAILAAEWLFEKKGFYTMEDIIKGSLNG